MLFFRSQINDQVCIKFDNIIIYEIIIKFMKSHFIFLYKHQEITKFVNFIAVKGMPETKKIKKMLWWAAKMFILTLSGPLCF
jgi:hypothetical protein